MDKEKIKVLAVENANKRIKEVNKNEISSIADYDKGLQEGFINGYEIAVNDIIKYLVDGYVETKRKLLTDKIKAIDTEQILNSGMAIKVDKRLIHESFVGKVYIKEND